MDSTNAIRSPESPRTSSSPDVRSHVRSRRVEQRLARQTKRLLDVVIATVAFVAAAPLCLVIGVLIRLDSKGPVIFSSERVGEGGKVFRIFKFRSMVADAEERLKEIAHLNQGGAKMVKIPDDPRVTNVGKILRKYSLDEIPQFWNVIMGDMSLVGPRPQSPAEVELYDDHARGRLTVPAGLTGWWQVTARDDPRFEVWLAKDLEYIERWSMTLDIKILFKTIWVVITGRGSAPTQP